jgi:hypothetical protein
MCELSSLALVDTSVDVDHFVVELGIILDASVSSLIHTC